MIFRRDRSTQGGAFLGLQPDRSRRAVGKPEIDQHADRRGQQSLYQEHPLPAVQAAHAVGIEQQA